ncbi:hypothetical protein [Streptomyces sp. ID05-47C]|uniref:hypothetical protein n=1 Tax=Streptomyces sp. ID05-47C TaxID=3028665 RepID=UPI0029AAA96F|nr:hypothetical protein [Streptomyces sp. ID05-47C]MDX3570821.1 hypothetical protein [Streptomyces sp. ID05-47C]
MKPLLYGAVLALLWLLFGLPLTVLAPLVQPVTVAFAAGLLARPHLTGRRWSR